MFNNMSISYNLKSQVTADQRDLLVRKNNILKYSIHIYILRQKNINIQLRLSIVIFHVVAFFLKYSKYYLNIN